MHAYTADALEGRDADTYIAEGTGVYHASHTILEEGLRKIKESARVCKGGGVETPHLAMLPNNPAPFFARQRFAAGTYTR